MPVDCAVPRAGVPCPRRKSIKTSDISAVRQSATAGPDGRRQVNQRPFCVRLIATAAAALAACSYAPNLLAAGPQTTGTQATGTQAEAPKARKPATRSARKRVVGATFGPHPQGLAVLGIDKNGVAARAGLKVGDLITEINGRETAPIYWEYAAALLTTGGDTVTVKVLGRGEFVLSFAPAAQTSSPQPAK
jgi:predicted metalloprotease with PDZ domain